MTAAAAHATLRELAAGVDEGSPEADAARLAEKVSARDDAAELRAALAELRALLVVHPRGGLVSGS